MVTPVSTGSLQSHSTEAHNLSVPDGLPRLQDEFPRAPLNPVSLYLFILCLNIYVHAKLL